MLASGAAVGKSARRVPDGALIISPCRAARRRTGWTWGSRARLHWSPEAAAAWVAIAHALLAEGAQVMIIARDPHRLAQTRDALARDSASQRRAAGAASSIPPWAG